MTSATLPSRVEHLCEQRLDAPRGRPDSPTFERWRRGRILLDQSAQTVARTHLNIRGDALGRKAPHDVFPAHRRRTCATSASIARRRRCASAPRRRWRRPARADRAAAQRAQLGREPVLGRLHQRAVERRAHRQRHRRASRRAPWRARRRAPPRPPCRRSRSARRRSGSPALTTSPSRRFLARLRHLAASRPRIAAIAPAPTGTASCM